MIIWNHGVKEKPCDIPSELRFQKRLCHVDHLLHSRVTSTDSEPNADNVSDLQLSLSGWLKSLPYGFLGDCVKLPVLMRQLTICYMYLSY